MAATTYEYKFVKIELKTGFKALSPKEDYHELVDSLSKEGWRLVQVFAPSTASFGAPPYFEVIFERPREQAGERREHETVTFDLPVGDHIVRAEPFYRRQSGQGTTVWVVLRVRPARSYRVEANFRWGGVEFYVAET